MKKQLFNVNKNTIHTYDAYKSEFYFTFINAHII